MKPIPAETGVVIVGAGFAGAATAWALGRAGAGPGVLLERESTYGFHASGRNAAIVRLVDDDAVVRRLALRSLDHVRRLVSPDGPLLHPTGGLTLGGAGADAGFRHLQESLGSEGLATERLTAREACARFPLLGAVKFHEALFSADEAVADIHALLTLFIRLARDSGFGLHTGCEVGSLVVEAGRAVGVRTPRGEVRAPVVVDASGAWAGRLGRASRPLPLRALRRHLFVSGPPMGGHRDTPFAWVEDASFYFRPEGDGLLLSPCDETPMAPCDPPIDPAAAELLAEKLSDNAPAFTDLPIRRSWACLRTFAPDRRPVIGPDPDLPGLFHVSGLGGFGMTASAAVGELAAQLITGGRPDWIDPAAVSAARLQQA
jgi:D-arginine dehydrogenase